MGLNFEYKNNCRIPGGFHFAKSHFDKSHIAKSYFAISLLAKSRSTNSHFTKILTSKFQFFQNPVCLKSNFSIFQFLKSLIYQRFLA